MKSIPINFKGFIFHSIAIIIAITVCWIYLDKISKEALLVLIFILSFSFLLEYYILSTVLRLNHYLVTIYTEHMKSFKNISTLNSDKTIHDICNEVLKEQI
jgi:hypothetical protein